MLMLIFLIEYLFQRPKDLPVRMIECEQSLWMGQLEPVLKVHHVRGLEGG